MESHKCTFGPRRWRARAALQTWVGVAAPELHGTFLSTSCQKYSWFPVQGSQYGSEDRQLVPQDIVGKIYLRGEFITDTKIMFHERNMAGLDLTKIKILFLVKDLVKRMKTFAVWKETSQFTYSMND